jgi:ribosome-associated heat shock protein Hsp15
MSNIRIDKWLWAARFFKTRSLAARACELGRVQSQNHPVKPAREVHIGDFLEITNASGDFEVEALVLSEIRGPASVARTLYRETVQSRERRLTIIEERKAQMNSSPAPLTRPSKRDRRKILQFRRSRLGT